MTFTIHVLGLPHTSAKRSYSWCAFTNEVRVFCSGMFRRGHQVTLYHGGDDTEAKVSEFVSCFQTDEQPLLFPERVPPYEAACAGWKLFNHRCLREAKKRVKPGDFVCLSSGHVQASVKSGLEGTGVIVVEPFVGYAGVLDGIPRAFKSCSIMNAIYGWKKHPAEADGIWDDVVIPYPFEPEEFPLGDGSGDYLLFVGRLIQRKGLDIVRQVQERTGLPLVVAGFGDAKLIPSGSRFVGVVEPKTRAELMGKARCVLMPTLYLEMFGAVAAEAQLCGTPAITTDWGAFPETVQQGFSGFRCRSIDEFERAVNEAPKLNRAAIRKRAIKLWSMDIIAPQYERWFERLLASGKPVQHLGAAIGVGADL